MADFSIWHVLPSGEMPTVRQVLECGGGKWFATSSTRVEPAVFAIGANGPMWRRGFRDWEVRNYFHQFHCIDPKPARYPMPTPEKVGDESRWRILCAHKPEGDACTLRTVDERIDALFDGDDQWVPLASQWGAGMVAIKESTCTPV